MRFNESRKIKAHRKKLEANLKAAVVIMGNDALNHFKNSFRNEGFTDTSLNRWKPRKGELRGGISKVAGNSRAVLAKTGRLKRSLSKTSSAQSVLIRTDVPYAMIHNQGGIIHRRAHKRIAARTVRVRGGYSQLGDEKNRRGKKMTIQGERHNVSGSTFKMPKRQFVGHSRKLIDSLKAKLNNKIKDAFR